MINDDVDTIAIQELYLKCLVAVPGVAESITEQLLKKSPEYRREYMKKWKLKNKEKTTTYYSRRLILKKKKELTKETSACSGLESRKVL